MIYLIIKSYLSILILIGMGTLLALGIGLFFILKPERQSKKITEALSDENEVNEMVPVTKNVTSSSSLLDLVNELQKTPSDSIKTVTAASITITSSDINAIAGDDVLATQLDLARAYIETGRKQLAKKILEYVVEQGSSAQQDEARILLGHI